MNYDGCCKTCKFWDTGWCDKEDSIIRYDADESCSEYKPNRSVKMKQIFGEIKKERERQDKKWGEQNHPMFRESIYHYERAREQAFKVRNTRDGNIRNGTLTWHDILAVEFAEVFEESAPAKQREKLIQVAAVAVAIIECLDRNK